MQRNPFGNFTAKQAALIALFVALIIIGAFLKIPVPPIPFTLQTLFVLLAGVTLGGAQGAICCAVYLIMGLIGLPVFTGGGGLGYALTPSFGFAVGFIPAAFFAGIISNKSQKPTYKRIIAAVFTGTAIIYAVGISYYLALKAFYLGGDIDLFNVFLTFWVIFIPTDIIKGAIVVFAGKRLKKIL
ncbi:MAG: biotin transporter BioY [Clostridia bacterium]|nr:biotin transporter BioY [Clostridia bacterium]